jgi:hypothetical protein
MILSVRQKRVNFTRTELRDSQSQLMAAILWRVLKRIDIKFDENKMNEWKSFMWILLDINGISAWMRRIEIVICCPKASIDGIFSSFSLHSRSMIRFMTLARYIRRLQQQQQLSWNQSKKRVSLCDFCEFGP